MLSLKNKTKRKTLSSGSASSAVQDQNHSLYLGTQATQRLHTQRLHTPGSKDDIMHLAISFQNKKNYKVRVLRVKFKS